MCCGSGPVQGLGSDPAARLCGSVARRAHLAKLPALQISHPRLMTRRVLSWVCGKFEAGLRRIAEVRSLEL